MKQRFPAGSESIILKKLVSSFFINQRIRTGKNNEPAGRQVHYFPIPGASLPVGRQFEC